MFLCRKKKNYLIVFTLKFYMLYNKNKMRNKLVIDNREYYFHPTFKNYAGSLDGYVIYILNQEPTLGVKHEKGFMVMTVEED